MKPTIHYLLLTLFIAVFSFPQSYAAKHFPDSHVKSWIMAGANPKSYLSGIDKTMKHSGTASAVVFSKDKNCEKKWCTLMQMIKADAYKGKRTRLSAWVKTENVSNWAGLWLRMDKAYRVSAFDNMGDRSIKGTTEWKQYEVVLNTDTACDDIAFGIIFMGAGKVWMDDVKLEIVGNNVPVTDRDDNNQSVSNLSFEKSSPSHTPVNWYCADSSSGYAITIDRSVFHDGAASAYMKSIEMKRRKKYDFGTITGWMEPDSFAGKRIRMSAWIKTEDVSDAGLWLRVDGKRSGEVLSFDNMIMNQRGIKGTNDWKKYEVVLDVPKESLDIAFGALFMRTGKLWFDEVKFEAVDSTIAVTSTYNTKPDKVSKKKNGLAVSKYILNSLSNTDFEEEWVKGQ